MQIRMHARNVRMNPAIVELAERRLGFALGQFASRIGQVTVRLDDVNGPRGGIDHECRLEVTLPRLGQIVCHSTNLSPEVAICHAADRLARRIRTELDSRRTCRRRSREQVQEAGRTELVS